MMKKVFQQIAEEENADYHFQDNRYWGIGLSVAPETRHYFQLRYKGHGIDLYYELGNHNLGKVSCELPAAFEFPDFRIIVRNHWRRLFQRSLNILQVECADPHFQAFLQEEFLALGLEAIARRHLFEPK